MKISEAISTLQTIQAQYGDLEIVGGYVTDDVPPQNLVVVNDDGMEVWPGNPNGVDPKEGVAGVFIE